MATKKAPAKKAEPKKTAPAKKTEGKKPAPAKKPEPKKVVAKKPEPKKVEPKKEEPKKVAKDNSVYHVSWNGERKKWEIKLAKIGGAAGKVIDSFNTKDEAMARAEELKASTGRKALAHKSKGPNKGKVHKI